MGGVEWGAEPAPVGSGVPALAGAGAEWEGGAKAVPGEEEELVVVKGGASCIRSLGDPLTGGWARGSPKPKVGLGV